MTPISDNSLFFYTIRVGIATSCDEKPLRLGPEGGDHALERTWGETRGEDRRYLSDGRLFGYKATS